LTLKLLFLLGLQESLSANESYQKAESEIEALMGVKVNHSTFQRLVQRTEVEFPTARQKVSQLSVDGGKVRVRTEVVPKNWTGT
jgi:hypothetical protein